MIQKGFNTDAQKGVTSIMHHVHFQENEWIKRIQDVSAGFVKQKSVEV